MTNLNTRTGYSVPSATHKAELTEVRRGTPMGELMRRYWHPVARSERVADLPLAVRALGEDLVLFRDKLGRPGLVHARCAHRGSSLLYGRIEEGGIRCCYHGWAFDVQGRCFDQPCEPGNGLHRDKVRQPWYPVEERYGLVWAYMGPPEKMPLLPRYDALENMREGDLLFVDDHNIGSGRYFDGEVPFNWLQHFENIHDFGHFLWLHYFHSGPQFGSRYGELDKLDFQPWERMAGLKLRTNERGVTAERLEVIPDGRTLRMVVETVFPAVRAVPNPFGKEGELDTLGFVLPVDDTHYRIFNVLRGPDDGFFARLRSMRGDHEGRIAADPHHFQRFPGDWEAQGSQGPITLHSAEHLASSDRGVVMLRRLYQQQLAAIAEGRDPINVAFEPGQEWVRFEAGQFLSGSRTEHATEQTTAESNA